MTSQARSPTVVSIAASSDAGSEPELTSRFARNSLKATNQDTASDCGSSVSETDDLVFHFRSACIPNPDRWARTIKNAGYDLDMLQDANLDEVASELGIPSGIKIRLGLLLQNLGIPLEVDDAPSQNTASDNSWLWRIGLVMVVVALVPVVALLIGRLIALVLAAAAAPAAPAIATATVAVSADCVDGDALITMADRRKKKIGQLKKGEKILAFHKQRYKVKTVVEVTANKSAIVYPLTLRSASGELIAVNATGGHPFFAQSKGWSVIAPDDSKFDKPVSKLQKGDKLIQRGGKRMEVLDIGQKTSMSTYNLILNGEGAFFVHDILSQSGLPSRKAKAL